MQDDDFTVSSLEEEPYLKEGELSLYEEDLPSLEERIALLKQITLDAVRECEPFADLFENPVAVSGADAPYIVFRANDAVTGRRLAVKCTNPIFTSQMADGGRGSENALEWEESAIKLLAGKKRCVRLHDSFTTGRVSCTIGGERINDRISFISTLWLPVDVKRCFFDKRISSSESTLLPQRALRLVAEILHSVQALHKSGLCHRDLKPSNIRGCSGEGKTIICTIDLESTLVQKGKGEDFPKKPQYAGTLAYAAPEMISGLYDDWQLALKADWYAVGCMMFELFDKRLFYPSLIEENGKQKFADIMENLRSPGTADDYFSLLDLSARDISLPDITFSPDIPPQVTERIQAVYRFLASFDARKRAGDDDIPAIRAELLRLSVILENRKAQEYLKKRREARKLKRKELNA